MLKSDELKQERSELIRKARNFLDTHEDKNGTMTATDAATYAKMEEAIQVLNTQIGAEVLEEGKRRMKFFEHMQGGQATPLSHDNFDDDTPRDSEKPYVSGWNYKNNFLKALRNKFRRAEDTAKLVEGSPTQGGYLVPTEFSDKIQSALEEENAIRQIATIITTESEHLIPFVVTKPEASWISEGQTIDLTTESFDRISLGAHKLGAAITLSNELLADSYYDLEEHLTLEFAKSVARKEEESLISGDGNGQPTGILTTIAANSDCYKTTRSAEISADDLINLQYSVRRPYRKNACWLCNDEVLSQIRKLKDTTQNYIWQPSLLENEPARIFGQPVYTSPYMPPAESGKIAVLYGDFSAYVIAERGQRTIRALRELFALQDVTAFLMLERLDGKLTDTDAIRGLKIK